MRASMSKCCESRTFPVPGSPRPGASANCRAAPGPAGDAEFALGLVAHRQVEEDAGEAFALQAPRDLFGGPIVGRGEFHRLEAGLASGGEALEERALGKEPAQVGGEARHDDYYSEPIIRTHERLRNEVRPRRRPPPAAVPVGVPRARDPGTRAARERQAR